MELFVQLVVVLGLLAVLFFVVRRVAGLVLSILALVVAVAVVVFVLERYTPAFAAELSYFLGEVLRVVGLGDL